MDATKTYPSRKLAAHYLMDSVPYGSGLRWTRAPIAGWMESLNGAPTGRTAAIVARGTRYAVEIAQ